MALDSRFRCSPSRNSPLADFVEGQLTGAPPWAPTESSGSLLTSLVPSRSSTPGLTPTSLVPAPLVITAAPAPTKDLFRQFVQAYMEDRRKPAPARAPAPLAEPHEDVLDRLLKARNPDLLWQLANGILSFLSAIRGSRWECRRQGPQTPTFYSVLTERSHPLSLAKAQDQDQTQPSCPTDLERI